MSYSDRLKDNHDNESSVKDENMCIERNCSQCNTCMKVNIKNLPRKDYCNECKKNILCLIIDAVN